MICLTTEHQGRQVLNCIYIWIFYYNAHIIFKKHLDEKVHIVTTLLYANNKKIFTFLYLWNDFLKESSYVTLGIKMWHKLFNSSYITVTNKKRFVANLVTLLNKMWHLKFYHSYVSVTNQKEVFDNFNKICDTFWSFVTVCDTYVTIQLLLYP